MRNNTEVTMKFFKMYFKILLATISSLNIGMIRLNRGLQC